ncbi:glycosyltransferase family 9 protein [Thalassotalea atypica]|uniref:glycosyltransferase family 9 protein n=1 Tax=Thalassotalea atypica TaxID=2054316 RepID=UPI00257457F1|nr:glycosyltransferase family 9 protein [Thalassotalea atypica]
MLGQLAELKKICILRLSAIGDVCHAVAMVQLLQRTHPNVEITWVVGKVEAMLLKDLPGVNFIVFDKKAGIKGLLALRRQCSDQSFDVLLHMQVALRASIASMMIPATHKIGFDRLRAKEGQWLFTNERIAPQRNPHVLDGFMGFAQLLGCEISQPQWHMPLTDEDMLWAAEQFTNGKPIATICPAASKAERNWSCEGYAEVAQELVGKGFTVAICGGPTALERDLADNIIKHCDVELLNLVGKTSLKQLLAVLKLSHLVVAPDTGPAHMAVTVGTPVIGLYAHSNPHRTGPYLYQQYVVSHYQEIIQKQHNKVLAKLPWGIRAKGSDLMDNIQVSEVLDKVRQLLADHYPELS